MPGTQANPYSDLPDYAFWRRAVSSARPADVDPVISVPFTISPMDAVATAGSCFAQYIGKTLSEQGFNYLVTEKAPLSRDAVDENYGVFPARYANVYNTRQLLQLFDRAYGRFAPADNVWRRPDGAFVDPFRPQIQSAGFPSAEAMEADRTAHLAAVRNMFERCNVFIFTLGLTEAWLSEADAAAVPIAPGVAGSSVSAMPYRFCNLSVPEMAHDLVTFVDRLRSVNPDVPVILTVSPVPLIATYEQRHVLVSTIYSKSALRVVAEMATQERPRVAYFPAYEIITGHHARYGYFEDDLRNVTPEGVARVMTIFARHFLCDSGAAMDTDDFADLVALQDIVCEEEALDP
jgi:GSCFA family